MSSGRPAGSDTPPHSNGNEINGRDRTPELTEKREKRSRDDDVDDRDRSSRHRHHRHHHDEEADMNGGQDDYDRDRERHRRHRHRDRDEDQDDERRERKRRHHYEDETEEEREERRRRRKEREAARDRDEHGVRDERDDRDYRDRDRYRDREERSRRDSRPRDRDRERDRSRESHRSHRSHRSRDVDARPPPAIREMTREEKEAEREKRDREMQEERREAARLRGERYGEMDPRDRRMPPRDRPYSPRDRPYSPARRPRDSPSYDAPPPPPRSRSPPPRKDPVNQLLDEVDSESRSIFVSQLAARLTSSDLGLFFEDKLGRGSVRDARVVTDRVSRRSKGIGYVELDAVELVNRALALSGTVVMGIPINIQLTEAERNRQGQVDAAMASGGMSAASAPRPANTYGQSFPPLSTGLNVPPGVEVDAHKDASIPYHRLFVSNLAFSLSPDDLRAVFESFGEIEFVDLHFNFAGESKGTAYVQFKDLRSAQMALDAMNNFDLAGRAIRVQTVQERAYVAEQIEDTGYSTRLDATQRQQLMFKLARTEPNVNLALSQNKANAPAPAKPVSATPTTYVTVSNMFNPEEETERNWDLDLAEDVKGEVEGKYGKVKRIKVDKMSAGDVYLEFEDLDAAKQAHKGLGGRFFGGRRLQASYISEAIFKAHL